MKTLRLHKKGWDYWGRMVYQSDEGHYYKRYERQEEGDDKPWYPDGESIYTSSPSDDFDGEPGFPLDETKVNIVIVEDDD